MRIKKMYGLSTMTAALFLTLSGAANAQEEPLPWIARSQIQALPSGSHWADATDFDVSVDQYNPGRLVYTNQNVITGSFIMISIDTWGRAWWVHTSEWWGIFSDQWWWWPGGGWVDEEGNSPPNPPLT